MRNYLLPLLLIIAAVVALWFQDSAKQKPPSDKTIDTHFPDYFMDNFSITSMNEQGAIEYTLSASKMLHFADDDSSELTSPFLAFSKTDRQVSVRASRAVYLQQQNILHLYDDVTIIRSSDQTQSELSIHTDYLKINTVSRIAETDRDTQVNTAELKLNSKGLIYNDKQGRLILTSRVKGIYEATH